MDDDDQASNISNVYAQYSARSMTIEDKNGPSNDKDWEGLNETGKDHKIGDSLKHVDNVKKKKMSEIILSGILVKDGTDELTKK